MNSPGSVRLLGAVCFVSDGGVTVELASVSQRRLLAVLALHSGATLRREHLGDLLGITPGAVRTTVSRLRTRLGDQVICTHDAGYRLDCPVDTGRFRGLVLNSDDQHDRLVSLEEALGLWHGTALDEFRHEPWAEAEAAHLDELRCMAIEERASLLVRHGRSGEAVASLEAHLSEHPLRDRSWGLLMEALAEEGRQSDALRRYQQYRRMLADEVGTEPSNTVRSIERRIAAGLTTERAPSERTWTDRSSHLSPPTTAFDVPLSAVLTTSVAPLGRHRELDDLESDLTAARSGRLRVVLVIGEAGIGKTTLLAGFGLAHHERDDTTVIYARCDEGPVPLQPLRGIATSVVEHAPLELLRAHCERFGGELLRIAPQMANRLWTPQPITAGDSTERHQLFAALTDLLRRVSDAGALVLLLDDLHRAEPTALLLLRHLVAELADAPVLVVAAYRDLGEHTGPELRTAIAELGPTEARRLHLRGLDDVALSDLAASVAGTGAAPQADLVEQLREQTAGNPLYASQLMQHLAESGGLVVDGTGMHLSTRFTDTSVPASLRDVVWSRVRALGPDAHDVLRAGAVLGFEFDETVLFEMCDQDRDCIAAALDAAVDAGLLVEGDRTAASLRFVHALVPLALHAEFHGSKRRRLHGRAARILQKSDDHMEHRTIVALARHCELAGDLPGAQRWATLAGEGSLAQLAPSEAASWFQTALDHARGLGRPQAELADLTERMGEARRRAGDPRAEDTLLDAAALAQASGAHQVLVRAALAIDDASMRLDGIDPRHLSMVEAALAVADQVDPVAHARLLAVYAQDLIHTPHAKLRRTVAQKALDLLDTIDDPRALPEMISSLTYALWGPGSLPRRRDLTARAVEAADGLGDRFLQFWVSRAAYLVAIESADEQLATASLQRMHAIITEIDEPRLRWLTAVVDTFDATMAARLDEAERHAADALELGTGIGEPDAFSIFAGQLFVMRSFAGRHEDVLPFIGPLVDQNPTVLTYRLALAIIWADIGRCDDALAVLDAGAAAGFSLIEVDHLWTTNVIGYAVLAIQLEDTASAPALLELLRPFADEVAFNGASSQGPIGAYMGKLESLLGDHEAADAHLRDALAVATTFGWNYHRATTLLAMAQSTRRRLGSLDTEAMARLDEADALAAAHGLSSVARQVAGVRG